MKHTPQRKVVLQYGNVPISRLIRSAETAAGGNAVICDQQRDLSVGSLGRADHAAALDAAERHGLEVRDDHDLFAD